MKVHSEGETMRTASANETKPQRERKVIVVFWFWCWVWMRETQESVSDSDRTHARRTCHRRVDCRLRGSATTMKGKENPVD
jgi:hypothetical protein